MGKQAGTPHNTPALWPWSHSFWLKATKKEISATLRAIVAEKISFLSYIELRNSLFGHVVRLDDHTPAHCALSQIAATRTGPRFGAGWRRRPGCPHHSWIQQISDGTPFSIRAEWSKTRCRGHSGLMQRTSAVYAIWLYRAAELSLSVCLLWVQLSDVSWYWCQDSEYKNLRSQLYREVLMLPTQLHNSTVRIYFLLSVEHVPFCSRLFN